jgi:carboxymethylenebutenolidase
MQPRVILLQRSLEKIRVRRVAKAKGGAKPMIEATLDITTAGGPMETFICRPERGGPFPPVFLLMDAHGVREELRDMARRIATVGYYVLLPNLYYRAGRDTLFGPESMETGGAEHTRMRAIRTKMTIPPVMEDVSAMIAFVDNQRQVKRGPVGCHGYCMSGPYALAAAARYPDRIAAAASYYGTWLVSEAQESPHLSLDKVAGELYIACAEHDDLAPMPMVEELSRLFKQAGVAGEIEIYPGVHHGFAFPQRWCYDKQAAERHWERLLALYQRRLNAS